MKKNVLTTFGAAALVLISIVSSKPAQAQDKKKNIERTIIIQNGDTVINSKKFSDLSKSEQEKIRKELKDMKFRGDERVLFMDRARVAGKPGEHREIFLRRGGDTRVLVPSRRDGQRYRFEMKDGKGVYSIEADTMTFFKNDTAKGMTIMIDADSNFKKRIIVRDLETVRMPNMLDRYPNIRVDVDELRSGSHGSERMIRPRFFENDGAITAFGNRSNSQVFSYNNTDKDGYTTNMTIRVSEVSAEQMKKITGAEKAKSDLSVSDLTFFPTFSNGKMNVTFNLPSKGSAVVSVLDNEFKPVFIDRPASTADYQKSFMMAKNGVYYLTITQNGNMFVRKVVKN